jgi:hypothetical protein
MGIRFRMGKYGNFWDCFLMPWWLERGSGRNVNFDNHSKGAHPAKAGLPPQIQKQIQ